MQTTIKRTELKYLIATSEAFILKKRLAQVLKKDAHSAAGPYFIRSVYFDDHANSSFLDKAGGFEERTKFRIRLYDFKSSPIKFEAKYKYNDLSFKQAATITAEDAEAFMNGDFESLARSQDAVLRKIYYRFKRDSYLPVVIVDYHRDAFVLDFNNVRVTFDSGLRKSTEVKKFRDAQLLTLPAQENRFTIMEIKYDHFFPNWLSGLIEGVHAQHTANSKYYLSRLI